MCLAEEPAGHAVLPQMIAKRDLANADRKLVPAGPVACHIAAAIGRHAAGPADRRLDIGVGEADPARGHLVKIGGVQGLVSGAAQIVEPKLVIHNEEDVLLRHFTQTNVHDGISRAPEFILFAPHNQVSK
jgi:hypothetical protein